MGGSPATGKVTLLSIPRMIAGGPKSQFCEFSSIQDGSLNPKTLNPKTLNPQTLNPGIEGAGTAEPYCGKMLFLEPIALKP